MKSCAFIILVWIAAILLFSASTLSFAKQSDDENREVVVVGDIDGLLANIERDNIELVMLPGRYVVPPCPGGLEEEVLNPTCGQMQQGDNSVLLSGLELELDNHGVPTGQPWGSTVVNHCGEIPTDDAMDGAVIDCGALPHSPLEFSCLVAGNHSVIQNLTICNGPPPECSGTLYSCNGGPIPPGFEGTHRNAIMISAGRKAEVEEVRLVNVRRGVLIAAGSNQLTQGAVRRSLIDGTELAGVFVWAIYPVDDPEVVGTTNARLKCEVRANRLTRIGRFPLIQQWAYAGGDGNESHVEFTDNVVDSSNFFGISLIGLGGGASNNVATFEIKGGRLEGDIGLLVSTGSAGNNNSNNLVVGEVKGLTIVNSRPAVLIDLQPELGIGNSFLLEMKKNIYLDEVPGQVSVTDDAGSDFEFVGSAAEFLKTNVNFDITDALFDFTDD